jgi:hypothetical protein
MAWNKYWMVDRPLLGEK